MMGRGMSIPAAPDALEREEECPVWPRSAEAGRGAFFP
ncbi:hypothetical protein D187_009472 [Cystobacter fuscus DSM 2262]|uniref:Uncharacterized protein n=1 Tax=Cystobacter fuscus (strain ATCC 25194 / DSM 2262 / NBRC 100088 / M29) TaxID=1242864 RepID=S9NT20_CYSF2|nr:hypothetical protein D187_009472 [Cystobacter fuscus DSM 2262]